ncbi:MAG TPA: NTP transferase domain-containing protein [Gaiellaceae bacterium]|nr:NTP transferase domain-containing protein [Gaiellaceae bacterium]
MASVVVPFRGSDPKQRLAMGEAARRALADAMLADVVAAAAAVGPVLVVAPRGTRLPAGATLVADPRRGQGAAVRAGLGAATAAALPGPYLVVNADLPCVDARDLLALAGAAPAGGIALVAAADGTTNALAFADPSIFEPVYGPRSSDRFAALGPSTRLDAPNLVDDVDTLADLARLGGRVGEHTRRVLTSLDLPSAA